MENPTKNPIFIYKYQSTFRDLIFFYSIQVYKIFFSLFSANILEDMYFFTRLKSTLFVFSFNSFHDFFLLSPIFHNSLNIYVIFVRDINLPSVLLIVYTFLLQCQIFHFNSNAKQFFFMSFFSLEFWYQKKMHGKLIFA